MSYKLFILAVIAVITMVFPSGKLIGQQWQPQKDFSYLQEISEIIKTGNPVVSVAENKGACYVLSGKQVHDISVGDSIVYIATGQGLAIIRYEPYTLAKKADYFERHLDEWGHKRLGFIHTLLYQNGEWIREISDNDGGHTAPYLAAMTYKYAVTGDEKAREEAAESFKALLWLEKIVPIEGFFARAIWSVKADKHERSIHGSGGLPAKWYPTPDGNWYWKGDTSSDEVTAHFYAVSIFHDLATRGKEKEMAKAHLEKIASYIIDCGWTLHDYWMGRYYGFIEAPETSDRQVISVERRPGLQPGAAPYNGPPRPEVF